MAHRDDHQAARHRIEALERELADARAETERARREAEDARAEIERADGERSAKKRSERAPKKRDRRRPRDERASATDADPRWPEGARPRFARAITILAAGAYAGAAIAELALPKGELVLAASAAALAAIVIGAWVLGRVHRAPEPFGGAIVNLLAAPIVLAVIAGACTDDAWPDAIPPGIARTILRPIVALAATIVGTIVTRSWASDAASSPIQPD